ncbi:hypothetical protein Tco_0653119 [Tanacetum coccineum]|uniref:Uncharacterized protein n=1 Tax=Tanacetum coccineum TaxID=301880 RepID=A0ABQ4WZP0_9ASTR
MLRFQGDMSEENLLCSLSEHPVQLESTSYTFPSNRYLKSDPQDGISDTEYGCALSVNIVRGCMRLLWLTESRNTTFCFFDISLQSLSPRNCIPPELLPSIKALRHDQNMNNAVSSMPEFFG